MAALRDAARVGSRQAVRMQSPIDPHAESTLMDDVVSVGIATLVAGRIAKRSAEQTQQPGHVQKPRLHPETLSDLTPQVNTETSR